MKGSAGKCWLIGGDMGGSYDGRGCRYVCHGIIRGGVCLGGS